MWLSYDLVRIENSMTCQISCHAKRLFVLPCALWFQNKITSHLCGLMRNTTRSPSPITSPIFVFSEQLPVFLNVRERPPNRQWPMGFRRNFFFFIYFSLPFFFVFTFYLSRLTLLSFCFFRNKINSFPTGHLAGTSENEKSIKSFIFQRNVVISAAFFFCFAPFLLSSSF